MLGNATGLGTQEPAFASLVARTQELVKTAQDKAGAHRRRPAKKALAKAARTLMKFRARLGKVSDTVPVETLMELDGRAGMLASDLRTLRGTV